MARVLFARRPIFIEVETCHARDPTARKRAIDRGLVAHGIAPAASVAICISEAELATAFT